MDTNAVTLKYSYYIKSALLLILVIIQVCVFMRMIEHKESKATIGNIKPLLKRIR